MRTGPRTPATAYTRATERMRTVLSSRLATDQSIPLSWSSMVTSTGPRLNARPEPSRSLTSTRVPMVSVSSASRRSGSTCTPPTVERSRGPLPGRPERSDLSSGTLRPDVDPPGRDEGTRHEVSTGGPGRLALDGSRSAAHVTDRRHLSPTRSPRTGPVRRHRPVGNHVRRPLAATRNRLRAGCRRIEPDPTLGRTGAVWCHGRWQGRSGRTELNTC